MLVASKEQIVSKMMGNRLSLSQFGVHRFGLFGSFVKNEQTSEAEVEYGVID